jgi:hypothetical protein
MSEKKTWPTLRDLLGMTDNELATVDVFVMNSVIAKGIPSLSNLDITRYVKMADEWERELRKYLPVADRNFYRNPHRWGNDLDIARLSFISWFLCDRLKVRYREDYAPLKQISYTDPTALFLCGIMDTQQGTCGNMATLFLALARRLDLPVSLACVGAHFICRFDDGTKAINIETSTFHEGGGFSCGTDQQYLEARETPKVALNCGSDLRAITAREMLGVFVGLRARHLDNILRFTEAEQDYLLARYLFPNNRYLYIGQNQISVQLSADRFEPSEKGHPIELIQWLQDVIAQSAWQTLGQRNSDHTKPPRRPMFIKHPTYTDVHIPPEAFSQIVIGVNPRPARSK